MKIAIPALGTNLDSLVDPRFSRAEYFLILNEKGEIEKIIKNPAVEYTLGADDLAAQTLIENAVSIVLVLNITPKVYNLISSAGVKVYQGESGLTVREIFELYKKNLLHRLKGQRENE